MAPLVECVPNFSEGVDRAKIRQITDAIEAAGGVELLSVEPGADTNRTVVTFVGAPESVERAAFAGIARATEVIDMRRHRGAHPRLGASDVVPFVPVDGVTMAECVALARSLGQRIGQELSLPVFLYEQAATRPGRRDLADIRRGEWEGLAEKLADPAWAPDFGPQRPHPTAGATVVGAREFLIAYNVNLNSTDKGHAADIAFALREKGRVARTGNVRPYYYRGRKAFYRAGELPCGSCELVAADYATLAAHCTASHGYDLDRLLRANGLVPPDVVGQPAYRPGRFEACKAIGWYVAEYRRAQVSINLTDHKVTSLHMVFDEARRLAGERGLVVTGSEIVGLVPWDALMATGRHYLAAQGRSLGQPAPDVLAAAVHSLGLGDVAPFDVERKVLGRPRVPAGALVTRSVADFTDEVSRDSPAPGGGSVAALAGALAAALAAMVANLAFGKEGDGGRDAELGRIAEEAQAIKDGLIAAVDADAGAFNEFLVALRLPQATPEDKALRARRMQEGLRAAVAVPWATAQASLAALRLARRVSAIGNPSSLSDAAVGGQLAFAGVRGALWNVMINLKDISDVDFVRDTQARCAALLAEAAAAAEEAARFADDQLAGMIARAARPRP